MLILLRLFIHDLDYFTMTSKKQFNVEQKRMMIEFMEQYPALQSGKFQGDFTFKKAQGLWMELTHKLNAIPGAKKEWRQWRKTWQDYKGMAKKKNANIRQEVNRTGGGVPSTSSLTAEEEAVIEIVRVAPSEGHPYILESDVSFTDQLEIDTSDQKENIDEEHRYAQTGRVEEYEPDATHGDRPTLTKKAKKVVQVQRLENTIAATEKLAAQNEKK